VKNVENLENVIRKTAVYTSLLKLSLSNFSTKIMSKVAV